MNRVKNLSHGLVGPNAGAVYMNRQIRRNWKGKVEGVEPKPDRTAKPLRPTAMLSRYMRQNGTVLPEDGSVPLHDPMTPAQRRRFMKKVRRLNDE